ncbi:MAG: hypothetical protein HQL95_03260 [Magnetococcales bacterium]|nr:hypothetical protein [Magnetococcales bacterium]
MNLGRRWRQGRGGLVVGLLALLLSACAGPGSMQGKEQTVPGGPILERYQSDQSARRKVAQHWSADGVLDLETPDQGRRNRIDLLGSGWERVRLRAYGPFQQVAAELLARGDRVQWVNPDKRSVIEVPASAEGLRHLIGVPIPPERFFRMIMGQADTLVGEGPFPYEPNGVRVKTRDGEELLLDPKRGVLWERHGAALAGAPYRVVYTWPDPSDAGKEQPLMPSRILVTLEKPKVRLEFIFRAWRFPVAGPPEALFSQAKDAGFKVSRPLEARP